MKRLALLLALALAALAALHAEVEFLGLDLGKDDALLFSARAGLPGGGTYDSLFQADLGGGRIAQLTVYPEHAALVDGGRRLQVQNAFGLFRSDAKLEALLPVPGFPAFARGSTIAPTRTIPCAASPDGAWVLFAEPTSAAYARLVLVDAASGASVTVAEKVEYSVERLPARWSPDSRYFVYAKAGSIHYYGIEQLKGDRVLEERYRRIGEGRTGSVRWARDGSLYYLRGSSLWRILPAEFFTQALYQGVAGMGSLAGKVPFPYDPNFDDFWVSSEGSRVILSKGGRSLFLVYLDPDDFGSGSRVAALPHLFLQGDTTVRDVLWPSRGSATVFTGSLRGAERSSGAYRFTSPVDPKELGLAPAVVELAVPGALELVLSPDESKVAVVTPEGVQVRSYEDWATKYEVKAPGTLHALWAGETRLVVAGSRLIESVDLARGIRNVLALSQAEEYGRAEDGSLLAKVGGIPFTRPAAALAPAAAGKPAAASATAASATATSATAALSASGWRATIGWKVQPPATSNESWRVYLDSLQAGAYRNAIMVRAVRSLGTKSLFPAPPSAWAAFPDREEPLSGAVFDHGSRIRRRELTLAFNLLDDAEGLVTVLNVLKDCGIRATFFVNGEFIRRNPGAARLLAGSGHEVGSMFFTTVDPADSRFLVDRDYVRRGLARAEDDWFDATGKELSLLWHTPYYSVSDEILEAGASMNYLYVGRDMDPLDWVGRADERKLPGSYLPAHAIVERVAERARPGSIIPIRLGIADGGRDDYLFSEIALLVDALRARGYAIVPASTLIEHAE